MKIRYNTKDHEPSARLKSVIEKKLVKLDRFFVEEPEAEVVTRCIKKTAIMEITVSCQGAVLRCERQGEDFFALTDECLAVLEKQIVRSKGKLNKRVKMTEAASEQEPEPIGELVRTKKIELMPMNAEEAVARLELSDHDFYIFENEDNGRICTVYRRKDGNYGLLEPM